MPWIFLDDHWNEHPKLAKIGPLARDVWQQGLAYCNRNLTDGFIPFAIAKRCCSTEYPVVDEDTVSIEELVSAAEVRDLESGPTYSSRIEPLNIFDVLVWAKLWEVVPGGFHVHHYGDWQKLKAEIEAIREQKIAAGQAGGIASAQARAEAKSKQLLEQTPSTSQAEPQAKSKQSSSPIPIPIPVPVSGIQTGVPENADSHESGAGANAPRHETFQVFLERLRTETNQGGVLCDAVASVYGKEWVAGGRIAKFGKDHGYGETLKLIFSCEPNWNGVDDPLNYVTVALQNKRKANGRAVDHSELTGTTDVMALYDQKQERERKARDAADHPPG